MVEEHRDASLSTQDVPPQRSNQEKQQKIEVVDPPMWNWEQEPVNTAASGSMLWGSSRLCSGCAGPSCQHVWVLKRVWNPQAVPVAPPTPQIAFGNMARSCNRSQYCPTHATPLVKQISQNEVRYTWNIKFEQTQCAVHGNDLVIS